eukprot:TRINITY_DN43530_c0_g1_i1.p1 TRINITY_DN43530_c0_g1~~TRINITY_DN43530_c0_g1_i1.p1  ORF type:complete len:373 (+),score=116.23 TRINITY_DN43530_c0_g1_i1:70-1119(+)
MAQAAALLSNPASAAVANVLQAVGRGATAPEETLARLRVEISKTGLFRDGSLPDHTPLQLAEISWPGSAAHGPPPGDPTARLLAEARGVCADAVALVGNAVRPAVLSKPPEFRFAARDGDLYTVCAFDADAYAQQREEGPRYDTEMDLHVRREAGQQLGMNVTPFLRVNSVAPGGAAEKAGVLPGMLIVAVNGKKLPDITEGRRAISGAGLSFTMTVRGVPPKQLRAPQPDSRPGSRLLWLRANVSGADGSATDASGTDAVQWQQPVPRRGTGAHRIVFAVLRQKGLLEADDIAGGREQWKCSGWMESRCSGIEATQVVVVEWDETVAELAPDEPPAVQHHVDPTAQLP